MSKHSKHGRGKHFRKMQRIRQMQSGANVMQPNTNVMQPNANVMPSNANVMQPTSGAISRPTVPVSTAPIPQVQVPKRQGISAVLPLRRETIIGDLKRIGVLSVVIVIVLIALYIFLK